MSAISPKKIEYVFLLSLLVVGKMKISIFQKISRSMLLLFMRNTMLKMWKMYYMLRCKYVGSFDFTKVQGKWKNSLQPFVGKVIFYCFFILSWFICRYHADPWPRHKVVENQDSAQPEHVPSREAILYYVKKEVNDLNVLLKVFFHK